MAYRTAGSVPIGGMLSFDKSFSNTPSLSSEFVEMNGQVLSDAQSVFNGTTIPNLNGASAGTKRYLRGSTTSGSTGGADTHTHIRAGPGPGDVVLDECHMFCPKYLLDPKSNLAPYDEGVHILRVK